MPANALRGSSSAGTRIAWAHSFMIDQESGQEVMDARARLDRRTVLTMVLGGIAGCATGERQRQDRADERPVAADSVPEVPPPSRPLRVAIRSRRDVGDRITSLSYRGGFDAKTAIYETLVRMSSDGEMAPGLATSWEVEDRGRVFVLHLDPRARFHDGVPVDARAVQLHFRRWVGLPEHGWLGSSACIQTVDAPAPDVVRIVLERPCALLPDLLAINPCSIVAPGALDREGEWVRPVGSGFLRFVELREEGQVLRCARASARAVVGEPAIDLVRYASDDERSPVDDLCSGELDAVVEGWYERIPRAQLRQLEVDRRFRVTRGPGGSVVFLSFLLSSGPTADREVRRHIAAALDRDELVAEVELGGARTCSAWAPPTIAGWPRGPGIPAPQQGATAANAQLRLLRRADRQYDCAQDAELHARVAEQLIAAGFRVLVTSAAGADHDELVRRGAFDLRLERTLGVPYDPCLSLARFQLPDEQPNASSRTGFADDGELSQLVTDAFACPWERERRAIHERIQVRMDREALIVPLFVPDRAAVVRAGAELPRLDHDIYRIDFAGMLRGTKA